MSQWTQADVDRLNATRSTSRLPAHRRPDPPSLQMLQIQEPPKSKEHKYRAVPCIVTADLTLFTKLDIGRLDAASSGNALAGTGSLKQQAARAGIYGEWFGSTKEGSRYIELVQHERAGHIRVLTRQVSYVLMVGDIAIGAWRSDFDYEEYHPQFELWTRVVEDTKGLRTDFYRWKKAHVEAQYGFKITET